MNALAFKFVASVLAVVTVAAGRVCTCASMHTAAVATCAATVPATRGEQPRSDHGCCRKTHAPRPGDQHPQPVVPAESDPCGHCDLENDAQGGLLDRAAAPVPAGGHDLVAWVGLLQGNPPWDRPLPGAFRWKPDDVPRPPLLRDLFHTHCQLTA